MIRESPGGASLSWTHHPSPIEEEEGRRGGRRQRKRTKPGTPAPAGSLSLSHHSPLSLSLSHHSPARRFLRHGATERKSCRPAGRLKKSPYFLGTYLHRHKALLASFSIELLTALATWFFIRRAEDRRGEQRIIHSSMGSSYVQAEVPVYKSGAEVLEVLQEKCSSKQAAARAMYSSVVGGIVLDPAMMVIPIDDHMVHRGHGVFDTAMIMDGCLYELDAHLDRFLRSAATARIDSPFPRDTLRGILVRMTAASGCRRGSIRYWLSSGPGDFLLSSSGCTGGPAFYGVVIAADYEQCRHGVRAVTTSVPMKPPLFATMKNVNYLPNVLSIMDAEDRGAFASVWVDEQGYVAEGPMVNVAFVTPERELLLPPFDNILGGCTAKRMLALAPKLVDGGMLSGVSNRHVSVEEGRRSVEMAFVGSGLPVLPIVEWDGEPIGDGMVGPLMLALSDLLWEDMKSGPGRITVPYHKEEE